MTFATIRFGAPAALLALALASPGHAAGLSEDYFWTGARLGATFGLGMGASQWEQNGDEYGEFGSPAITGGVFAGFDVELAPGLVFGIEGGLNWFNSEASETQDLPVEDYRFRSLGAGYIGLRGGVEVAPRTLLYGRAAYAAIHAQSSEDTFDPQQEFLHGYQVAVGLETEVMDNVTIRVEGAYTDALTELSVNADNDIYRPQHLAVNIGVTYRLGDDGRPTRDEITGPIRSWTGGYAGLFGMGMASNTENGLRTYEFAEGPVASIDWGYGGYLGVNLQLADQWVVGLEADASMYETSWDYALDNLFDFATSDHKGAVSARLGFLANPQTLIYAKGGWGLIHVLPVEPEFAVAGTEPQYLQTLSAGVGVETMVNEHMLLRAEGVYTTAMEEYRFTNGIDPFYARPSTLEARVGAALLF